MLPSYLSEGAGPAHLGRLNLSSVAHSVAPQIAPVSSSITTSSKTSADAISLVLSHVASALLAIDTRTFFAGLLVVATTYLLAVRHLRSRSIRKLEKKYGSTLDEFRNIDYKEAQSILGNLFLLEAPWLFLKAKDFAFLRVSSVPASCLCKTLINVWRFTGFRNLIHLGDFCQSQEDD